jgi:hypothetical protein
MANTLKNEVTIELGGKQLTLRPSFGCLLAIESRTGKSIVQLTIEVTEQRGTLNDAVIVFEEATKAAGNPIKKDELVELIEEVGILSFQIQLATFYNIALYGGPLMPLEDDPSKKKTPSSKKSRGTSSTEQPLVS